MIRGLPASIIAHAAFFGASYLSFPYWGASSRAMIEFESVDVSFADIGEINNIAPLVEQESDEPEAAAPEEPEEVPEEPAVEEELPEAEEDVTNEDTAPAEEDPEELLPDFEPEEPEDEPEPEPEPEKEPDPAPKTPRDSLSDFLNQSESTFKSEIETRREQPEPTPPPAPKTQTALKDAPKPAETRNRRGAGERNGNTARIEAILYSKIVPCWDDVVDLPFPDRLNVRLGVKLNQNGTVAEVTLIDPARAPIGNAPMRTAIDRAKRAVRKCAPYNLPDDDYDVWREGTVNLGPAFSPTNQR
ncbi:MAG: hypothetical protein ABJH52_14500 [Henriciella sp.]